MSDIVADSGRPLRLRYCNNVNTLIKEEELPVQLSLDEVVANIKAVHAAQHLGIYAYMSKEAAHGVLQSPDWCVFVNLKLHTFLHS